MAPPRSAAKHKLGANKALDEEFTTTLQEEILVRTSNSLASLARVALEVLGMRDLSAFLLARKMEDSDAIRLVPNLVFSKEIVKFVTGSITAQASLVVRSVLGVTIIS